MTVAAASVGDRLRYAARRAVVVVAAIATLVVSGCRSAPVAPSADEGASSRQSPSRQSPAWPDVRVLAVRVLVDQYVAESDDAVNAFVASVRRASPILERDAGIRLQVSAPEPFRQPGFGWDISNLVKHLRERAPQDGDGAMIWFCRSDRRGDVHGRAAGFGQRAIVIAAQRGDGKARVHPFTVAHEIAHLFGAVHTSSLGSVMSPVASWAGRLDPANAAILAATRHTDLRVGVEAMDDHFLSTVASLTRDASLVPGWDPVGHALHNAFLQAASSGELPRALQCLDRRREIDPSGSRAADASNYAWLADVAGRRKDHALRDVCQSRADALRHSAPGRMGR